MPNWTRALTTRVVRRLLVVVLAATSGLALSACSHPQSLGTGPYYLPTTSSPVSSSTVPTTIPPAPQRGWVPVIFHGAKVRVPLTWEKIRLTGSLCSKARQPGTIWVGRPGSTCHRLETRPGKSANLVIFGPQDALRHGPLLGHQRVHGYPADIYSFGPTRLLGQRWLEGTAAYYFPSLGVTVAFTGPLGIEVLETIHSAT